MGVHNRTVLSREEEASRLPDELKSKPVTGPLCPTKRNARSWGLKFQIITEWSKEEEASWLIEGLKARPVTTSLCPLNDLYKVGSCACKTDISDFKKADSDSREKHTHCPSLIV